MSPSMGRFRHASFEHSLVGKLAPYILALAKGNPSTDNTVPAVKTNPSIENTGPAVKTSPS